MQEVISNQLPAVQKLTNNYWTNLLLNGTATLFLDEDQLNLIKVTLVMLLPLLAIYARVKVSEITSFVVMAVNTVNVEALCHSGCGS